MKIIFYGASPEIKEIAEDIGCHDADHFEDGEKVKEAVSAIIDAAHAEASGDGIVAVLPVEKVFRIRTKKELTQKEILDIRNSGTKG